MKFVKMHGCGNDYVYLDAVSEPRLGRLLRSPSWTGLVRRMSHRHTGIGSDGVIVLCPATKPGAKLGADVRMRMFNADGSESEMCGNGVRCVAKFAHDRLRIRRRRIRVETGAGVLPIDVRVRAGRAVAATVGMGEPRPGPAASHVDIAALTRVGDGPEWNVPLSGRSFAGTFVSMGNPHFVVFRGPGERGSATMTPEQVREVDLASLGRALETHPAFMQRMNVHIAGTERRRGLADRVVMRSWERGAGLTQACGTGACAVAVAGVLTGRTTRDVHIELPGGVLSVRWDANTDQVFMTGEAVEVFEGVWPE